MAQPVIQHSFATGEWAPTLYARVDLQKYHSAAATLRNFFVDYRGGASTRSGTKYILQAYKSATAVRLIPFQASFTVNYVLEFGDQYVRFYNNGSPILETAVTGGTGASVHAFTITNTFNAGDWVYATAWGGLTNVNGKYFKVSSASGGAVNVTDLNGAAVVFTGVYTAGGQLQRVYTVSTPYAAADLAKLKFAQNVNTLVLCHPSYVPYILTLVTAANWTLTAISFAPTIAAPTGQSVATTLGTGAVNYAYVVTAVDANGQESAPSAVATLVAKTDLRTVAGTNIISWSAVSGAQYYNVYKSEVSYAGTVPSGAAFGFIGFTTGVSLADSNIPPDFSETPPISNNPFQGSGVASATITNQGTYTTVPTVTFANAPPNGVTATGTAILQAIGTPTLNTPATNAGYAVGQSLNIGNIITVIIATIAGGKPQTFQPMTFPGSFSTSISSGSVPASPIGGVGDPSLSLDFTWGVTSISIQGGAGYLVAPGITFGSGTAAATAMLGPASNGNPAVPAYFDQRLVLAGPNGSPQQFNMSQPGSYFNYSVSNPTQPDDAIEGTVVSNQLNSIKSMVALSAGLVALTDKQLFLINGGGTNAPITPADASAQGQSFSGTNDVPPILANANLLFVQAKGSYVRDATFNFYTNIYTGTDISVLSSHLFYGYQLLQWAWAEEPFKTVWAVRNDGVLLSLAYLKEQELIGWAHHDTTGLFNSVCCVTETVSFGTVDATYVVVQRVINGNTVQYIERFAERIFPTGQTDAWCVDAGLQYNGVSTLAFTGAEHLAGATVTGLATDNTGVVTVITPFAMPTSGSFNLPAPTAPATGYTRVTVGLGYTADLQTLPIDTGDPTIQSKMKKIPASTIMVASTLGLKIGTDSSNLVTMKDLVVGNVGSMSNKVVTDLFSGEARTFIDPLWQTAGQFFIRQTQPLPASILGTVPQLTVGDTAK